MEGPDGPSASSASSSSAAAAPGSDEKRRDRRSRSRSRPKEGRRRSPSPRRRSSSPRRDRKRSPSPRKDRVDKDRDRERSDRDRGDRNRDRDRERERDRDSPPRGERDRAAPYGRGPGPEPDYYRGPPGPDGRRGYYDERDRHNGLGYHDRDRDRRDYSRDRDPYYPPYRGPGGGRDYDRDRDRDRDYSRDRDRRGGGGRSRSRERDRDRDRDRSSSRTGSSSSSSSSAAPAPVAATVAGLLQRVIGGSMAAAGAPALPPAGSRFGPPPSTITATTTAATALPGGAGFSSQQQQLQQDQQQQSLAAMMATPGTAPGAPLSNTVAEALERLKAAAAGAGASGGAGAMQAGAASGLPISQLAAAALSASTAASAGGIAAAVVPKHLKELYCGNLPQGVGLTAAQIKDFFNTVMMQAGLAKQQQQQQPAGVVSGPVTGVRLSDQGNFAFLEFRSVEETDLALGLNGIPLLNATLKIGRPKGYQQLQQQQQASLVAGMGMGMGAMGMGMGLGMGGLMPPVMGAMGGLMPQTAAMMTTMMGAGTGAGGAAAAAGGSTSVPSTSVASSSPAIATAAVGGTDSAATAAATTIDPSSFILVSNLAPFMTLDSLKDILEPFGALGKHNAMLPMPSSESASALISALVSFENPALVEVVIGGLQGLDIGGYQLQLSKASKELVQATFGGSSGSTASAILELSNIIVIRDLHEQSVEDVNEIREDVSEECSKYGRVTEVLIPPLTAAQQEAGKSSSTDGASVSVFVVTASEKDAAAIANALKGRKFEGRPVGSAFVSSEALDKVRQAIRDAGTAPGGSGSSNGNDNNSSNSNEGWMGEASNHYGGVSIPPPEGGYHQAPSSNSESASNAGAPEDGFTLPQAPDAADLD